MQRAAESPVPDKPRSGLALAALSVAVLLAHLWLADHALPDSLGEGAADTRPARIEVAFVRQLAPSAPPPATRAPAPRAQPALRTLAAAPALSASSAAVSSAASAAAAASSADAPDADAPQLAAATPEPAPPLPTLPTVAAPPEPLPVAAAVAASASAATSSFEWPPSTRISYRLSGNYRGPVEGQAHVEWLRAGTRYQVGMDLSIGPSFAPLMSRKVSSDGEITDQGLRPRRYDEETKVVLMAPRRLVITMEPDRVKLPGGSERPRPPLLQDSASQFVQLTWLFTLQPDLLQPGRSVDVPLALPRVVETWTYDVLGSETLDTPAGPVPAIHVKPRREPKPGGDLTAEIWVAPSLQYLPVRILIRQDTDTWIDLSLSRLPEQAAPGK